MRFWDTILAAALQGGGAAAVVDEAETTALVARFTTPPTSGRKSQINTLILALKNAGVWAKLDALYVMAAADAQAAQRNWVADAYNLTETNAPTFTADQGYTGDGAASYLDTGFNPTSASSPKYVRDSATIGFWSRTSAQSGTASNNGRDMGAATLLGTECRNTTDQLRWAVNSTLGSIGNLISASNTDGSGHFLLNRSASNSIEAYRNGASLGTNSKASTGLPNSNIMIGKAVSNLSTRQFAAGHIGQSLNSTEAAAFYNALQTYMTAVGA